MSSVRILNPVPGGAKATSQRKADDYVKRGRARWEGNAIRFRDDQQARIHRALMEQGRGDYDPVEGFFHWKVGVSDKHTVMKAKR